MKPEEVFGLNAGKVWGVLKEKGPLTVSAIAKETQLKINDVFGALGWLGREGKIEIINDKKGVLYKLLE
ncbi:MAG: winged helix-turn-helix domain-containing protein [Candidatus Aenigmatarchaeota archaeon]